MVGQETWGDEVVHVLGRKGVLGVGVTRTRRSEVAKGLEIKRCISISWLFYCKEKIGKMDQHFDF